MLTPSYLFYPLNSIVIDRCNPRFDPFNDLEPLAPELRRDLSDPRVLRELQEWRPVSPEPEEGVVAGTGGGAPAMDGCAASLRPGLRGSASAER